MERKIRIFIGQVRNLSISEMFCFLGKSLFRTERILIYIKKLDTIINSGLGSDFGDHFITKGGLKELECFRKNMTKPSWEFSCHLYDRAKDYFIYKSKGEIEHISWIYYRGDPNRIIDLDMNETEVKYSLTLEPYRGRGLYGATLIYIQRYLKESGFKRVFICVNDRNKPSIRGIEKAGFKFISKIKLVKILGVQFNRRFSYSEMSRSLK